MTTERKTTYPKLRLFLPLLLLMASLSSVCAISVGPTGTGKWTFNTQPVVGDWSTLSIAGGGDTYTDAAGLEGAVQTLSAADISTVLGSSATQPPSANAVARRNTVGNYIQTRPTGNAYLVLMAHLTNDTGQAASTLTVTYNFASLTNDISESIDGHLAFYSVSGAAGSWQRIPEFGTGSSGQLVANLRLGSWAPGAELFLLWADDNGPGGTGATGQEGTYTIDDFEAVAVAGGVPILRNFRSSAVEVVAEIEDGNPPGAVDPAGVTMKLNNAVVTAQAAKVGTITTVTYRPAAPFPSGSTNVVEYTFYNNPPQTATRTFIVDAYSLVPAAFAVAGVNTSLPGFKVRVHQLPVPRSPGDENSIENAEKQLAGGFIDPGTGNPYPNEADLSTADPVTKLFSITDYINWSVDLSTAGNFSWSSTPAIGDQQVPGIPGPAYSFSNVVAEIVTMLDLKAGLYTMGVNSDDGFKVTVGQNPRDAFATVLGSYGTGRSASDTLFDFIVAADGIYPFRLLYWQGQGAGSVEWFTVNAAGVKTLINDRSTSAGVKAYITEPVSPAFVRSAAPAPGAKNIATNTSIVIVLADAGTLVQTNTIQLYVNDQAVSPLITKTNTDTTVFYDPPVDFVPEQVVNVRLVFSDNATPANVTTRQYSFQIKPIMLVAIDDVTTWRYENNGLTTLGTAWTAKTFDDSGWPSGKALLAAETGATPEPIRTTLSRTAAGTQIITDYFRTHFNFTGNPGAVRLFLRHVVDDGAVFYLNGSEIYRFGLAQGTAVTSATLFGDHENRWEGPVEVSTANLQPGDNVLAVEVHQTSADSSDTVFGAELRLSTIDIPRTKLLTITPAPDAIEVLTNAPIQFTLMDGTQQVAANTIQLAVNGQSVTPTISKPAGSYVTTVSYLPPAGFTQGSTVAVQFSYGDDGVPSVVTNLQYSFYVRPDYSFLFAIDAQQQWRYENSGLTNLGTAWFAKGFDDSAWPSGMALFAYETGATAEPIRTTLSRTGADGANIITDYFRTHFTFNGDLSKTRLRIRHVVDDGVAIYLNGAEAYRFYLPPTGPIDSTTLAVPSDHENRYEGPFDFPATNLVVGDNVIAAEVHQNAASSSDVVFGLELQVITLTSAPEQPKFTSWSTSGGNLTIQWTGTGVLQYADSLTGQWADVPNPANPYTTPITPPAKFFRIRP